MFPRFPRFPRRRYLPWLLAAGCALPLGACTKKPAAAALADFGPVQDFQFTERSGRPTTLADLRGKVWVANFIFTSCTGPCPLMSGQMKQLQTAYQDQPALRFVSITTDPATDTPAVLSAYAARFAADPQRWLFLTGNKADIVRFSQEALKLSAGEDPGMHSSRFVLVDGNGHLRGWYESRDEDFEPKIRQAIDSALASAADVAH